MASHQECTKVCFACNRPSDTFRHIHIPASKESGADEMILCIPCVSTLVKGLYPTIMSYLSGGYAFDDYGRSQRGAVKDATETPLPTWLVEVLNELRGDATTGEDPRD